MPPDRSAMQTGEFIFTPPDPLRGSTSRLQGEVKSAPWERVLFFPLPARGREKKNFTKN
jgi:hypothetical protein